MKLERLTYEQTALVTTLILGTGCRLAEVVQPCTSGPTASRSTSRSCWPRSATGHLDGRTIRDAHVPDTIEDAVLARYAR